MKYNPLKSSQSYTLYIVTSLYAASTVLLFSLGLLMETPILWAYFVISTLGELYFLVCSTIEIVGFLKGHRFEVGERTLTFYEERSKKLKTIGFEDILEFSYKKNGDIQFVYKNHGRTDCSLTAHVFSRKECDILEGIRKTISRRDAKVDLFNE